MTINVVLTFYIYVWFLLQNGFKFQTPYSTYLTTNVSQSTTHGSDEASSQIPIIEDNKNVQVNADDNNNTASNCETCIVEQRSSNIQAQSDCYRRSSK